MNEVEALARPRRRPCSELVWAIGASYAYRVAAAWLLALPVVQLVRGSNLLQFPEGDRRLFDSGGLYLLEVLSRYHGLLLANLSSTLCLLLFFSFGSLLPKWLVLRALSRRQDAAQLPGAAARVLPRLALLGALLWLTRALLLVVALAFAATVRSYFASARDERLPDVAFAATLALGLLPQLALSVWHDVASALVVDAGLSPARASGAAFGAVRRRTVSVIALYLGLQLTALALLLGGSVLVDLLDVAREGTWRGLLALGTHQLVVVGGILLHVCWLSYAVRAARSAQTEAFL
jgi:hypothetical protein